MYTLKLNNIKTALCRLDTWHDSLGNIIMKRIIEEYIVNDKCIISNVLSELIQEYVEYAKHDNKKVLQSRFFLIIDDLHSYFTSSHIAKIIKHDHSPNELHVKIVNTFPHFLTSEQIDYLCRRDIKALHKAIIENKEKFCSPLAWANWVYLSKSDCPDVREEAGKQLEILRASKIMKKNQGYIEYAEFLLKEKNENKVSS